MKADNENTMQIAYLHPEIPWLLMDQWSEEESKL